MNEVKETYTEKKLHEECGIFGGFSNKKNIPSVTVDCLNHLQHRGQEGCGICCFDENFKLQKGVGSVSDVFREIPKFKSPIGIGHVRYSTQGNNNISNIQPFLVNYKGEELTIAHNGNVRSAAKLRRTYENSGEVFLTTTDTEMILKKLIADLFEKPSNWSVEDIYNCLSTNFNDGAWSILIALKNKVYGFRDPHGFRPLMLCIAKEGSFLASEDCAFKNLNVVEIIEIQPAQAVEIDKNGYKIHTFKKEEETKCVFEHIYFAKPQSNIFGRNVYQTRVELGRLCAKSSPVNADIIVPVMDTGLPGAIGYSQTSGIEMHMGLLRNHRVGRSFIQPTDKTRTQTVKEKLSPIEPIIKGKRVILVDDSLVRGITSKELVKMIREAGAKEVHLRITSPMLINSCFWGVDIPTKDELIATRLTTNNKIGKHLKANSIGFLELEEFKNHFGKEWCYNCFCNNLCEENQEKENIAEVSV